MYVVAATLQGGVVTTTVVEMVATTWSVSVAAVESVALSKKAEAMVVMT